MKTLPNRTIPEIAEPILARAKKTIEEVRESVRPGGVFSELTWVIAMVSIEASKEGWSDTPIARYLNCSRWTVRKHRGDNVK